jgi:predicted transcriptional regulator
MTDTNLLGLTAEIVAAHLSNNHMTSEALPALISSVYSTLATVGTVASAMCSGAQ